MKTPKECRVLFYAFRYALGRKTYAVSDVVHIMKENWDSISHDERMLYHKEINEAITLGKAGMDMDIRLWREILALPIENTM